MSTFTLYEDYTPPSWSMRPKLPFYLEVLKNGVLIQQKKIDNKAMYLIGKNEKICDIVLDNPTISRKHAVLQSKNTNEFYLYDLGSTHGTFVNNVRIPTKLFHKLKPYDQLKFGQSLRMYILRCEDLEKEDANVQEQELQKKLDKRNAKREFKTVKEHYLNLLYQNPLYRHMKPRKKEESEIEGIDWGIDDEQEVYRYHQEQEYPLEPELLLQLPGLSEQLIDKINKYSEKLSTYRQQQEELDNLLVKERKNFGLDEQSGRNKCDLETKVQELGSELESLEVGLKFVLFGDRVQKINKFEQQAEVSSEEEDEFYDNTLKKKVNTQEVQQVNNEIKVEKTTESYQQLKKRLEQLIEERDLLNNELLNIQRNEEKEIDEEDELDNYMKQTAISIAQQERPKLLDKLKSVIDNITKVSEQLKFVKPDIKLSFFNDEEEENPAEAENNTQVKPNQNLQSNDQVKSSNTTTTFEQLKKLKEQAEKEQDEEEDEEMILEKARRFFEKEAEKESQRDKQKMKQLKEQQKVQEILQQYDKEQQELIQQQQKQAPKPKPHSRNYRDTEVEKDDYIDITKFQ
ncbi:unnamed protein product (macronuclear) [Paramecium tetraurelia]|uniref:FHA domain-containing protein n=1 Tax=Paramecium tetraurelia TaxID=5888 RepID=A0DBV4_PARTE|nr:uncharacterized protein GSPATT00015398001 [Paramecium tetraurelia]CAK80521.1 unnamed protein product [Paramecium tetraurelia]|eukprot:XP_001447918.1 hypothetical protein (macronuclear) [Paramecium tetraurelia strain d4-2]